MKLTRLLAIVSLSALLGLPARSAVLSAAFTYTGHFDDGTKPVTGFYDLQFALYDAATNGSLVAPSVTNGATNTVQTFTF